jgi:DNA-binding GntR family transcriptional regulator
MDLEETRQPASQRAYNYIRDRILNGELATDTFVEEEHISTLIGVSRTPVREAFGRLQAEHLIDLVPRRGARVRGVTLREMFEFYEVRRIIEGHVAVQLCRGRLGAPACMARVLAEMRTLLPAPGARYMALDTAFHEALVAASDNAVLIDMYSGLSTRQQRVALISLRIQPNRPAQIHKQHETLFQALEEHDETAALRLLDVHLRPIAEVISYYGR